MMHALWRILFSTYNPQKQSLLCSFSLVTRWMKHQSLVSHVICFMLLNICIVRERSTETSKVLSCVYHVFWFSVIKCVFNFFFLSLQLLIFYWPRMAMLRCFVLAFFHDIKIFHMRLCTNRVVNLFFFTLYQVADFGVSAQLTRTISRRKVLTLLCHDLS